MSLWNLIWIIPVCFCGMIAVGSLWWRFLNWLGKNRQVAMDKWAERLWPGVTGETDRPPKL